MNYPIFNVLNFKKNTSSYHNDLKGLNSGEYKHLNTLQYLNATNYASLYTDGLLSKNDYNKLGSNNKVFYIGTFTSTPIICNNLKVALSMTSFISFGSNKNTMSISYTMRLLSNTSTQGTATLNTTTMTEALLKTNSYVSYHTEIMLIDTTNNNLYKITNFISQSNGIIILPSTYSLVVEQLI